MSRTLEQAPERPAPADDPCRGPDIPESLNWPFAGANSKHLKLVGIVVLVAAAGHLLAAWVAYVIFGVLWVGFAIWSKTHR